MITLAGVFLIALIVPFLFKLKFKNEVTFMEWGGCLLLSCLISGSVYFIGSYDAQQDVEILNGQVNSKKIVKKKCKYPGWYSSSDSFCTNERTREVFSHYETNYCTDSKGNSYACGQTAVYDTEYKYDYPWEQKFYIYTSFDTFKIPRVDKQGAKIPPRYAQTNVGDPASTTHSYTNYLLNAEHSILSPLLISASEEDLALIPAYPGHIYDYYRIDRVVTIGVNISSAERKLWNSDISEIAKVVGPLKQANPIIVLTSHPKDIRYAIERKWFGGKKNDVIVLVGLKGNTIDWVDVITFLSNKGNEFMTRQFKNQIMDIGTLDRTKVLAVTKGTILEKFDREPMENIEELKNSFDPPIGVIIASYVTVFLLSLLLSIIAVRNDIKHYEGNKFNKLLNRIPRRFKHK